MLLITEVSQTPERSSHGIIAILIIVLILAIAVGIFWYFTGHHAGVREFAERFIPERFLPEFTSTSPAGDYSAVSLVGEDDIEDEDGI